MNYTIAYIIASYFVIGIQIYQEKMLLKRKRYLIIVIIAFIFSPITLPIMILNAL